MIHLRLIVPSDRAARIIGHLRSRPGVAHLVHLADAAQLPHGDVVLCDVAREAADGVIEWLQVQGVHRDGAITAGPIDTVVSDAAARAERDAPGEGADALIWEEVEAKARTEARLTPSFLVFMGVASAIATVGILLDSPILIVGAMVVGPEYGPLAALCVALVRRRRGPAVSSVVTLATGIGAAALTALVATAAFLATGLAPGSYKLGDRELTAFISHPDGMAAVVAVLAGVAGMLSLTQGRSGALVGVLVSVTTIPAVANAGVATAYGEWAEVRGACLQLAVNLAGLVVAGVATLAVQHRFTSTPATAVQRPS